MEVQGVLRLGVAGPGAGGAALRCGSDLYLTGGATNAGAAGAVPPVKKCHKAHRSQSARPPTKPVIRLRRGSRVRDLEDGQLDFDDEGDQPRSYNPFLGKKLQDGTGAAGSRGGSGTPEGSPMLSSARRSKADLNRLAAARRSRGFGQQGADENAQGELLGDPGEDGYRLRNFSLTPKGIINRGDSIRRRNSRSNSIPSSTNAAAVGSGQTLLTVGDQSQNQQPLGSSRTQLSSPSGDDVGAGLADSASSAAAGFHQLAGSTFQTAGSQYAASGPAGAVASGVGMQHSQSRHENLQNYRVALMGASGVGKHALVNQFMTSECINVYERSQSAEDSTQDVSVGVVVNSIESELLFALVNNTKVDAVTNDWARSAAGAPQAYVLMYSVTDKSSWERLEHVLARLQARDLLRNRATIVVGNKTDLVRSRSVSDRDGKELASSYKAKFIEISVACNHNVDELLVGLVNQIRLHEEAAASQEATSASSGGKKASSGGSDLHRRPTTLVRASRRVKRVFSKVWGKSSEDKDCENLSVL